MCCPKLENFSAFLEIGAGYKRSPENQISNSAYILEYLHKIYRDEIFGRTIGAHYNKGGI